MIQEATNLLWLIFPLGCLLEHHLTSAKNYPEKGKKKKIAIKKCWAQYFKVNLMWAQICPENQELG